jgi:AbrB family looped-hinge helix DNA binding protein
MTLSSKFQIAIPRPIREQLSLEPGQKLEAVCMGNHIQLVPIKPLKAMRGFLKGVDSKIKREQDRDL